MITLNPRQIEAVDLAKGANRFILLRGGSRSGKSWTSCYITWIRAWVIPNSRHGIFRQTAVDVRRTLFDLTFRQVMEAHTPGIWEKLKSEKLINDTEMTIELPNGSLIMFDGLDDTTRQDRILGNEYTTIFVNEVTQFRQFDIFQKLISRLSENKTNSKGKPQAPKLLLDCNPTTKRHWTYKAFIEKVNPISGEPWPRPDQWQEMLLNPIDNANNISSTYLEDLENLSSRDRKRFLEGEWQSDNDNAMFKPEWWSGDGRYSRGTSTQPGEREFTRILVAVDPAGSSRPGSDETGIIVVARDEEGEVYVLQDLSGVYQPDQWARVAIQAFHHWNANGIVTETNFGKEMVPNTIRMIDRAVPIICVTAKQGKSIRAEPVATLYEQGHVHHLGYFPKLEGQMEEFHLDWNRTKDGSPDRLDALVWGVTELGVIKPKSQGGSYQKIGNFWGR